MYFDAHCHLNDEKLYNEYETTIADFVALGGRWLVTVWCDYKSSHMACDITASIKKLYSSMRVWATVWVHPSEVCFWAVTDDNLDQIIEEIQELYKENKQHIYAIWECWIDLHYPWAPETIQLQQELLARQCQIAMDTNMPIVIHSRDGFKQTVEVMHKFPSLVYYVHCFGYGPEEVTYLLQHFPNLYIWYDCNISYPKAQPLRDACLITPVDKILLETDAPYLAPQFMRGQINSPAQVAWLYQYIADLRGMSLESLQCVIASNYEKIYL